MSPVARVLVLCAAGLLSSAVLIAAEPPPAAPPPEAPAPPPRFSDLPAAPGAAAAGTAKDRNMFQRMWTWSDARLRGIFEDILPDTQERRTWRVSVQPHFRDFLDEEYVRLPVSFIYGFNNRAEGELEVDSYFPSPFKDGEGRVGVSNLRPSFKYRWTPSIDAEVEAASGFQIVRPITNAPRDLTQGVNRYSIFTTLARPSPTIQNLEGFLNLSYDFITPSSALGVIPEDEPQDDFYRIGTGVLYRRDGFTYGLSLAWAHTVDGESTNFVSVTPSVIYDVPPRFTFKSPGRWQIGAAVEAKRYGAETGIDVRVRVRWLIDFRQFVRNLRNGNGAP